MCAAAVVELEEASVRLGHAWVLAGVNLRLAAGEALWITGANGAGKSTLLALLSGVRRPTRGRLRLFGAAGPPWPPAARQRIATMGHAHGLYEGLGGAENLRWLAALGGLGAQAAAQAAARSLEVVGLGAVGELPVARYSAGMVRRLALARLLLWGPALMLVDEPFVQLDAAGAAVVQRALAGHTAAGGSLVFTSHDAALARPLAGRRLHLAGGFATPLPLPAAAAAPG